MHPDSNRSTMKNPNARDDRYERILRLHWIILERRALSRVSQRIRSRVDVSQIVNDAADEWIQIGVSLEKSHHGEQLSDVSSLPYYDCDTSTPCHPPVQSGPG